MHVRKKLMKALYQHCVEQMIQDVFTETAGSEMVESDNAMKCGNKQTVWCYFFLNCQLGKFKASTAAAEKAKPSAQTQKVLGGK